MSPKLPHVSGREVIRAFERAGWSVLPKRGKGDHIILHKPGVAVILSVPDHDELGPGLLRKLIRLSGLTVDEFTALL